MLEARLFVGTLNIINPYFYLKRVVEMTRSIYYAK